MGLVALVALVVTLVAAPAARAQDSDAPEGALGHWLPAEQWLYEHWLPYDEDRLYELLDVDRGDVWRHLRDDAARNLAQLGRRHGYAPQELALALVEPRREDVSEQRFTQLRERALRTVTQGHLSQHLLFHNLHQRTIPNRSPEIFGTASVEVFCACAARTSAPSASAACTGATARRSTKRASGHCARRPPGACARAG
jgi:hypothetical protein